MRLSRMQVTRSNQLSRRVIGGGDALSGIERIVGIREQPATGWLACKCNPARVFQVPGIRGCMNQRGSFIILGWL